jgi:hypothetical protein
MSLLIRRDAAGAGRAHAAEKLRDWARAHGFAQRGAVSALDPYIEHVPPDGDVGQSPYQRAEQETAIEDILANAPSCRPEHLTTQLAALRTSYASESQLAQFLRRATGSIPPARRVAVLNALTSLPSDDAQMRFGAETIFSALSELIERWRGSSAVTAWREEHLRPFLLAQLPNAVRYSEYREAGLAAFMRLAGTGTGAELVIDAAARHIDELPAGGLYELTATLGATLEPGDIERLLDWSFATLEDGDPPPPTVGPLARERVLSGVLWSLFANPDKSVRWGAAHAARRLLAETDGERLAAELLAAYRARDGGLFADDIHDFLWMSAQLWLMMTLARVAGDRPDVLVPIGADLAAIALDGDWPHASVREFARRAALLVADDRAGLLSSTIVEALTFANRPRSCFSQREHRHGGLGAGERGEARWHFSMDVERYWFASLGQFFREPHDDMLRRGERWIVDVLEVPTAIRPQRDDPRIAHVPYAELDRHHGSSPAVESSRTAVEDCALMLAAGELVDEGRPVLVPRYEPVTDPWADWLDAHLDASASHWISDVRAPTPPDPVFLCAHVTHGAWPDLDRTELTARLAQPNSKTIIVDAYVHYSGAAAYGHDWRDSALVEPATAQALLRALELADDMSFFVLPKEPHADGYAEHQIDDGPFRLLGWIREIENYADGLEKHDPLARISLTTALPRSSFRDFHGARLLGDERTLVDRAGDRLAWMHCFSDLPSYPRDRYRTDITVSGRQTFVQTAALLRYLRATGMHLIIKGHADRRDGDPYQRPRQRDDDRVQELNRVILIEHSGDIRRLEGHRIVS